MLAAVLGVWTGAATAGDTGAATGGDWSFAATWTNGVPGGNDTAFIGSGYPNGSAATATVTLSQDSGPGGVFLGYGSGTSGTIDLGGFNLSTGGLYLGYNGSVGEIQRTGGGTLSVYTDLYATPTAACRWRRAISSPMRSYSSGSSVTTASAGNLPSALTVYPGATLNLGAGLALASVLELRRQDRCQRQQPLRRDYVYRYSRRTVCLE